MKSLYHTFIHPHINYCILLWGFNSEKIKRLQKQAIRAVTRSHFLAHSSNLFHQLNILKFDDIFELKQIIFNHNFLHGSLPLSLSNILARQDGIIRRCQQFYDLKPPRKANTESAKTCIRYSIPIIINSFDKEFIDSLANVSILTLKRNYKKKMNSYHVSNSPILNCYVCSLND